MATVVLADRLRVAGGTTFTWTPPDLMQVGTAMWWTIVIARFGSQTFAAGEAHFDDSPDGVTWDTRSSFVFDDNTETSFRLEIRKPYLRARCIANATLRLTASYEYPIT